MVENRLDLIAGSLRNGTLGLLGDAFSTDEFDTGNSNVALLSAGETMMYVGNGAWLNNNIAVNKSAGSSVTIIDLEGDGDLVLGSDNRNLDIQNGHVFLPSGGNVTFDYRNLNVYNGGSLVCPKDTLVINGSYLNFGGDLIHNGGTVAFEGASNSTFRCDNHVPDRFFNVSIQKESNRNVTIRNGDTLYVENRLDLRLGQLLSGAVSIEDTCLVHSSWGQG